MKKITTRIAAALLLGLFCVTPALAKVKSRVITVGQDFIVAGTPVKAGTYRFSFDDQSNELTITDRKTKQVVARAEARAESRGAAPLLMEVQLVDGGSSKTLVRVAFNGERQHYALEGNTAAR